MKRPYLSGYLAGLSKRECIPPVNLTDEEKASWLRGFDNARQGKRKSAETRRTLHR